MSKQPRPSLLRSRAGHIDNSITLWIILILALIAIPRFLQLSTGQSLTSLWAGLPGEVRRLLITAPLLLLGAFLASGIAAVVGGDGIRSVRGEDGRVFVRMYHPAARTFGLGLLVVALYVGRWGFAAGGWPGWTLVAVALLLGAFALVGTGLDDRAVLETGTLRWESRIFGAVTTSEEHEVDPFEPSSIEVGEHTTGGAFGQPLTIHHTVRVGSHELHNGTSKHRAEALGSALSEAVQALREEQTGA